MTDPVRYHLTEPTIIVNGKALGKGWLLMTEEEYASLSKVQEMRLCEANRVFLRPNTNYRFTVDPKCRACREAAERAGVTNYSATPVQTPEEELSDIADMLQAWLTDNTEHVFEEEPDVDQARSLLLERCGDL